MRPPLSILLFHRYDGVIFKQTFTFFGLQPHSQYEVRVRAKNEEGWSESGKSFIFTTPRYYNQLTKINNNSFSKIKV